MSEHESAWDGHEGTAGGTAFGAGLAELLADRSTSVDELAAACDLDEAVIAAVLAGKRRIGLSALAAFAHALHVRPIEFLQRTRILGLSAFAAGLDPLYFLPEGDIRYSARIYMREINPRHAVPEVDMTRRNPILAALAEDPVLDPLGRLEVELAYLLRAAVATTGGSL
jgi:transcriptional regulator with XRE-family HTH domain